MSIKDYSSLLENIAGAIPPSNSKNGDWLHFFLFQKGSSKREAALQAVGKTDEIISNAAQVAYH